MTIVNSDSSDLPIEYKSDGSTLVISGEDIPFGAYQAIYHKLTKKVEKRSKSYKDAFELNFSDIQNLNDRLNQLVKQFDVKSCRCQVSHALRDDTSREFSSFEKFKLADLSMRSRTRSLSYDFDFLIILKPEIPQASEVAQRFKIEIVFDQDFIEDEDYDAPHFIRGMFIGRNIQYLIEYSDYAVSESLSATVENWISSLPKKEPTELRKFLQKSERFSKIYLDSTCRTFIYLSGAYAISKSSDINWQITVVALSLGISSLMFMLCNTFVEKFYTAITAARPLTRIKLTVGDFDYDKNDEVREKKQTWIARFMFVGIFLTVALSILSNYLYDILKIYFTE